jgi:hypothetical protein
MNLSIWARPSRRGHEPEIGGVDDEVTVDVCRATIAVISCSSDLGCQEHGPDEECRPDSDPLAWSRGGAFQPNLEFPFDPDPGPDMRRSRNLGPSAPPSNSALQSIAGEKLGTSLDGPPTSNRA